MLNAVNTIIATMNMIISWRTEVRYCIQDYFEKRREGTRNMSAQEDAVQAKGTSNLRMYAV